MAKTNNNKFKTSLFGLMDKKERWGLSWRGLLLLVAAMAGAGCLVLFEIQPFLAVTDRVDADYLVMEGWVHPYAARATVGEFQAGHYKKILITGGPFGGSGVYGNDSATESYAGAGLLRREGMDEQFLQRVPRHKVERDRTYGSALALRAWFEENKLQVHGINIVTESAHARRTRLLFQKALGPGVKVGIISVRDPDYDPQHWWRYSEGVREVLGESIAWLYAAFIFQPPK